MCKWRGLRISVERIAFRRKCLENSVVPHQIYKKVKRLRPRYASSIGRAFVKNEIIEEEERLAKYTTSFQHAWRRAREILTFTDWIRLNKLMGENGRSLRSKLRCQYSQRLDWLRTKRFGSEELNTDAVFNLSDLTLSRTQLEVLTRGPQFGIPVEKVCKEEIMSEFELYFSQLRPLLQSSDKGKEEKLKANLANLAHEYSAVQQDRLRFPLGKEHMKALREFIIKALELS